VQTIGNILVLALLIAPAATARLLTDRLGVMMALAPAIGGLGALVGLYTSWSWDLPTGGTIVLVLTVAFLLAWFLSPRQGLIGRLRRQPANPTAPLSQSTPDGTAVAASTAVTPADVGLRRQPVAQPDSDVDDQIAGPRRRLLPIMTIVLGVLGTATLGVAGMLHGQSAQTPSSTPATSATATPRPIPTLAAPATDTPIAELADPAWVAHIAEAGDIPERAMAAYAGAALALAQTHPECGIGWNTLAAIGLVETEHGTSNGSRIDPDGVARPGIVGTPLDGEGTDEVPDTDHGEIDGDPTWDRAVGPMQFLPATWAQLAEDGNRDGDTDINNIDDASLTAGSYLCDVGRDLTQSDGWIAAISAYNAHVEYSNRVAEAADHYGTLR
jgi:hypothetical protein